MLSMRSKLVMIIIAIFIIVVILLAFIFKVVKNSSQIGSGDSGNKQLADLKNDEIFNVQPPDTQMQSSITQMPAQNKFADFGSPTSRSEIKENFVSNRPVPEIYQFYEQLAIKEGWQMENSGSNGFAETWTKTFSGKTTGFLSLEHAENYSNGQIYTLSGSITTNSK